MHTSSRRRALRSTTVASALALSLTVAAPGAGADEDTNGEVFGSGPDASAEFSEQYAAEHGVEFHYQQNQVGTQDAVKMPGGATVRVMGDILGTWSQGVGMGATDLGVMAPLGEGKFAMIFGDSFTGGTVFDGDWMSPTGLVGHVDKDGFVQVSGPLNDGNRVRPLISYAPEKDFTLLPSDIINIDGTLYMQGMWNRGLHNVSNTQIWKSDSRGKRWTSVGYTSHNYLNGLGDMISWEQGPDGYIYVVMSSFERKDNVYLSRFKIEDIGDRDKWELFNPGSGEWGDDYAPIIDHRMQAGEMNLRYIQGYWVLVVFNNETGAIEVRISDEIARNWNDVPVTTIAKNGSWANPQSPRNWSQPYGGYIVPGSTIDNLDVVISQWNTGTHKRYMATQFNVRGLDEIYGIDAASLPALPEPPVANDIPGADGRSASNSSLSSGMDETTEKIVTIVGVLGGIAAIAAMSFPFWRDMLPPQLRQMLHI